MGLLYTGDFESLSNMEQDWSIFVGFLREPFLEMVLESLLLVKLYETSFLREEDRSTKVECWSAMRMGSSACMGPIRVLFMKVAKPGDDELFCLILLFEEFYVSYELKFPVPMLSRFSWKVYSS